MKDNYKPGELKLSHVTSTMCSLDELIFQTVFISIHKRRHIKRVSSIIKIASYLDKCQFVRILLSWLPSCHMTLTSRHALWHIGPLSSIWATGPLVNQMIRFKCYPPQPGVFEVLGYTHTQFKYNLTSSASPNSEKKMYQMCTA